MQVFLSTVHIFGKTSPKKKIASKPTAGSYRYDQLQRAGAKVSGEDAELLAERFDPADRGKVDVQALVVWLTSGFDLTQVNWHGFPSSCVFEARSHRARGRNCRVSAWSYYGVDQIGLPTRRA